MCDGNEAAASIAYRATSLAIIYPITPSSPMAESYEDWSNKRMPNIWGEIPEVRAMQSEAGAIGAVHGALNSGTLATTFTASQGLLLMIPNMFKIAGELSPFVMHVSARAVAKHALSIFGDHSDVMACRSTGFAMLASNSPQEAHDLALVAHAATLESRVPFLHFFDGFRTSHELNMIEKMEDETIREMIPQARVDEFRARALTPENPMIKGTAQNPDVFFQGAEAANPYYNKVEEIVAAAMQKLGKLCGRKYAPVEYVGDKNAEHVIIAMGSACETIEETLPQLPGVGLIKIRLYRPFPAERLKAALPKSVKRIAVLDRTKESGAIGEPLYLDVKASISGVEIIRGRYGLSSKEFTPAMVKAVAAELSAKKPKTEFTVGIDDDVTKLSLEVPEFALDTGAKTALFYGIGADGTVGANKNSIKIITSETELYGQAYFEYDSKKSGGTTISHLRFSEKPIRAPYLVGGADFLAVHHFPLFFTQGMLKNAKHGATLLINSPFKEDRLWDNLPAEARSQIVAKNLKVFAINAGVVALETGMGRRINTIMQTAFFHLSGIIPEEKAIAAIKKAIEKTYASKGREVVEKNYKAVDAAIAGIHEISHGGDGLVSERLAASYSPHMSGDRRGCRKPGGRGVAEASGLLEKLLHGQGDSLKVSELPADGAFPTATSKFEKRAISEFAPKWDAAKCVACGKCVFACPHAVIRAKMDGGKYTIGVSPKDCTGCTLCATACPAAAISMQKYGEAEEKAWTGFEKLPNAPREQLAANTPKNISLMEPLFEFPGACAGCGEAGYIRLATQLFGDRMIIANATGCSSIYGGNLPTTPYAKNSAGRGPAWSNSLFEDNAEYGYGQAVAADKLRRRAEELLKASSVGDKLKTALLNGATYELTAELKKHATGELKQIADALVKKSIWIIGGDGWAYDIGYGGLDHILNMAEDVNVLVLDTEVYSNTGGQQSKATPRGASAKFATGGRALMKKDLGLIAMANANAYVAKIAMGANEIQTIKAMKEAESFRGPSLIIAYSPCIAHGFDLAKGGSQAKAAVASGHWELYRFDPRRIGNGESPLQMDSPPATVELRDYLLAETRYKALAASDPERFEEMLATRKAENDYRSKFMRYLAGFKG